MASNIKISKHQPEKQAVKQAWHQRRIEMAANENSGEQRRGS